MVIDHGVETSRCYQIQGLALAKLRRYAEAERSLRRAIALNYDDSNVRYALAFVLNDQKKHDEAIPILEQAVGLSPRNLQARFLLGLCYVSKERTIPIENFAYKALEQFRVVASLKPDFPSVHRMMAKLHASHGDTENAVREFTAELDLYPKDAEARAELADSLIKLNQYDRALEELSKAERDVSNLDYIHYMKAKAYRDTGRSELATQSALRAIELNPRSTEAHHLLGRIYEEAGRHQLAAEQMRLFQMLKNERGPI